MSVRVFSGDLMGSLIDEAKSNPRRRKHKNLHADYQEACQRFFNAIEPDSYLRPHCHGPYQGAETLVAIKGLLAFIVFGSKGEVQAVHLFGAGNHAEDSDVAVGVEVQPGQWHTVISLESGSILLEMKGGPFDPQAPKYFAPWAPEEMTPEGQSYLDALRKHVSLPRQPSKKC
ncbi:hypothetical protein XA67_03950 [Comamonas thiooxydans]|uniref:WbuC family cupin fold metalloprotein n=1 Tax=Comamonas thiooxydans TaxID=363952 RepID=UPI00062132E9|nr:WbuC family cupin fold metalloprotein [Comamonas thiooxydans]KKI15460.1 hypothetical protein XA67_03950 [Comamonas thiooxydans]